jgi:transposase-like protein
MTKTEGKTASTAVKDILLSSPDGLRGVILAVMQQVLEAEMDEVLGASRSERTLATRLPLGPLRPHVSRRLRLSRL